jgi:hypothetical protein
MFQLTSRAFAVDGRCRCLASLGLTRPALAWLLAETGHEHRFPSLRSRDRVASPFSSGVRSPPAPAVLEQVGRYILLSTSCSGTVLEAKRRGACHGGSALPEVIASAMRARRHSIRSHHGTRRADRSGASAGEPVPGPDRGILSRSRRVERVRSRPHRRGAGLGTVALKRSPQPSRSPWRRRRRR